MGSSTIKTIVDNRIIKIIMINNSNRIVFSLRHQGLCQYCLLLTKALVRQGMTGVVVVMVVGVVGVMVSPLKILSRIITLTS